MLWRKGSKNQQLGPDFQSKEGSTMATLLSFAERKPSRHNHKPSIAGWQFVPDTEASGSQIWVNISSPGELVKTQILWPHPQKCCWDRAVSVPFSYATRLCWHAGPKTTVRINGLLNLPWSSPNMAQVSTKLETHRVLLLYQEHANCMLRNSPGHKSSFQIWLKFSVTDSLKSSSRSMVIFSNAIWSVGKVSWF